MATDAEELFGSVLSSYQDRIGSVIQDEEQTLNKLKKYYEETETVQTLLKELPLKLKHPVIVPYGKHAFFPGHLVHTNELMMHLGGAYYIECTSHHAVQVLARRMSWLQTKIGQMEAVIDSQKSRLLIPEGIAHNEGEGFFEITESVEESDAMLDQAAQNINQVSESGTHTVQTDASREAAFDEYLAYLDDMERLEEQEEKRRLGKELIHEEIPTDEPEVETGPFWAQYKESLDSESLDASDFLPIVPPSPSTKAKPDIPASPDTQLTSLRPAPMPTGQKIAAAAAPKSPSTELRKGFLVSKPKSPSSSSPAIKPVIQSSSSSFKENVDAKQMMTVSERSPESFMNVSNEQAPPSASKVASSPTEPVAFTGMVVERQIQEPLSNVNLKNRTDSGSSLGSSSTPRVSKFKQKLADSSITRPSP